MAFRNSVADIPASVDAGRRAWPLALGRRFCEKLEKLGTAFSNDSRYELARLVQSDKKDIELRLTEGRFFHALYSSQRIEQRLTAWLGDSAETQRPIEEQTGPTYNEVSKLFPDRIVKQWEEMPMPKEWSEKLRQYITEHQDEALPCVRSLSSVNPALGLIAAHQLYAIRVLAKSGITLGPGISAVTGDHLDLRESIDSVRIHGALSIVPLASSHTLLIIAGNRGHLVPLSAPRVTITATPAIGFRAAGLADISLDCTVKKLAILSTEPEGAPDPASYLAIALGAGDYLCRRIKEHATGRVQFPGQMLDTEGRDGIAKLGAVKALIARTEAWRLLLETLYEVSTHSELRTPNSEPRLQPALRDHCRHGLQPRARRDGIRCGPGIRRICLFRG